MNAADTIVVTGASAGIGRATVSLLLERGYTVLGIARDFSKCNFSSTRFTAMALDLSRLDELPARFEEITGNQPSITGLVCCAGSGRFGSLEEFSCEQIRELIDLNLTSQICAVRALLPAMKRRQTGTIILMGSEAALTGGKRGAVYSAAKFGLRGLAQSLRQECASSGVRVSIINPGMVKTGFFDTLDFRPGDADDNYILPEDVAAVVLEVIETRSGTVIDEINMSPGKKVIHFKK
ncbi:MAG: SDR family oxidoreductase [Gammaproteobacteria bacterium]|jgi:short-subunit dehydrogenase|nr:SDR family oxidoreductase [Gammaproteobacteria bacterium]